MRRTSVVSMQMPRIEICWNHDLRRCHPASGSRRRSIRAVSSRPTFLSTRACSFELPFRGNLSEGSFLFVEYFFCTISCKANRDASGAARAGQAKVQAVLNRLPVGHLAKKRLFLILISPHGRKMSVEKTIIVRRRMGITFPGRIGAPRLRSLFTCPQRKAPLPVSASIFSDLTKPSSPGKRVA